MKCSIVIRSYNEEEHIGRLLLGIREQNLAAHEVILVDSGSTDKTVEIAQAFDVHVVPIRKEEFSFGRALNVGCEVAEGDILVFASAHVYPVHRLWLKRLAAPFENAKVVLSYGRQRGNHLNKFSEHQIFKKWFPAKSVCPQKSYFCNNANCAIRREAWVGQRYDEVLSGLEDLAWAKAAQEKGGWITYVAEAEIIHVHDETWNRVRNRYRREAMAMKKINDQAKFSLLDFMRLLPRNVITDYRAAYKMGVLSRELLSILLFRLNQFWGTYRGYSNPCEITSELRDRFYFPAPPAHLYEETTEFAAERINYETLESTLTKP